MTDNSTSSDLLIVGAGIAGITAAVEAAETGFSVTLIEKNPYAGGKVAQFNQYFPKLCPPVTTQSTGLRSDSDMSATGGRPRQIQGGTPR